MINSLSKDSHITQNCRLPKSTYHSKRSAYNSMCKSAPESNPNINLSKPAERISFSGLSCANKPVSKIYTNKAVKNFIAMAADSQAVFSAVFALGLTCLLRPAAIMALPGNKKNKDDKKYASAHSIASGIIGYAISIALFKPIANGMKKIAENPAEFIKKKNSVFLKDTKAMNAATTYVNILPEALLAAPRAVVTVALIPPILKYVFGWEKKKPAKKEPIANPMIKLDTALNFKSANLNDKKIFQNFSGGVS